MFSRKGRRIPIGIALRAFARDFSISRVLVAVASIVLAYCVAGCPDVFGADRKLVVAQGGSWRTDGFASRNEASSTEPAPPSATPVHVDFATCLVSGASADLYPGDSFRVRDVGTWQCGTAKQFYLLAEQSGAFTFLHFDDGRTRQSYDIPPIGAIQPNGWLRLSPVVSDGDLQTTITALPEKSTRVNIDIFDGTNHKIASESFDAGAPVTQYVLKAKFRVGSIEITTSNGGVGCIGCALLPLYGFVSVSAPDGGNARILPF